MLCALPAAGVIGAGPPDALLIFRKTAAQGKGCILRIFYMPVWVTAAGDDGKNRRK